MVVRVTIMRQKETFCVCISYCHLRSPWWDKKGNKPCTLGIPSRDFLSKCLAVVRLTAVINAVKVVLLYFKIWMNVLQSRRMHTRQTKTCGPFAVLFGGCCMKRCPSSGCFPSDDPEENLTCDEVTSKRILSVFYDCCLSYIYHGRVGFVRLGNKS